jgi:hypothetical protein
MAATEDTEGVPFSLCKSLSLPSTQESEMQLLQYAKQFAERIQQQQFHLQQADAFPDAFSTEVSKMREQLLKYQNEYNAVKERDFHNQYRLNR